MLKAINIKSLTLAIFLLLGGALPAAAEQLAEVKTQLNGAEVTAQLLGEKIPGGYADGLLLLLKDKNGKIITAHKPSVAGGYNCTLTTVQIDKGDKKVLLSTGRGNWRVPSEYRIIDFKDAKNVQEVFADTDNFGVVKNVEWAGDALQITMADGKTHFVEVDEEVLEDITRRHKKPKYNGLFSLTPHDLDNDGVEELLSVQSITADGVLLADVGAVWKLQETDGKRAWKTGSYTIMLTGSGKNNTINDGVEGKGYVVLPRKMLLPGSEATFPQVVFDADKNLQAKINAILLEESSAFLEKFYAGKADMAFNTLMSGDLLLCIQLISGKEQFVYHCLNIDAQKGKLIKIEDLLDTKKKGLRKLLNELCTNKKMNFDKGVPQEWYLKEDNIFFIQHVDGKDEVAGFALGNLQKFLKKQPWITRKLTNESAKSEITRKNEQEKV